MDFDQFGVNSLLSKINNETSRIWHPWVSIKEKGKFGVLLQIDVDIFALEMVSAIGNYGISMAKRLE
jgi:hypothetical protein